MKGKIYSLYCLALALLLALGSPSQAADKSSKDSNKDANARHTERRDDKAAASARQKISINAADSATLQTLPGVGPEIAEAIIAARPFKSVDELKDVKGIGDARFEKIRPMVTVTGTRINAGAPATSTRGTEKSSQTSRREAVRSEAKVNINTASQTELESLLGIGPVKAQAIIDGRPYKSTDEIMKVKGIKEGTYEEIQDRITVR